MNIFIPLPWQANNFFVMFWTTVCRFLHQRWVIFQQQKTEQERLYVHHMLSFKVTLWYCAGDHCSSIKNKLHQILCTSRFDALMLIRKLPWYVMYPCPGRCPPWNVSEWPPPWWWPPTAPGWSSSLATPAGNAKSPQLPVYSLGRKIDPASCSYYRVITITALTFYVFIHTFLNPIRH